MLTKATSINADSPAVNAPFCVGEIADVIIKSLITHQDGRGSLCEMFRHDELELHLLPAMAYISETLPGMTRGPHEHERQTDLFCFLGSSTFHLYLWDNRIGSPTYWRRQMATLSRGQAMNVLIPPGIVHAYRNVGDMPGLVVNCPNQLYAGAGHNGPVDEIRHEDDPHSPFQIDMFEKSS